MAWRVDVPHTEHEEPRIRLIDEKDRIGRIIGAVGAYGAAIAAAHAVSPETPKRYTAQRVSEVLGLLMETQARLQGYQPPAYEVVVNVDDTGVVVDALKHAIARTQQSYFERQIQETESSKTVDSFTLHATVIQPFEDVIRVLDQPYNPTDSVD